MLERWLRPQTSLRAGALLAALAAASGPSIAAGERPLLRVLVRDRSASVRSLAPHAHLRFAQGLGADARLAVIDFGETAAIALAPTAADALPSLVSGPGVGRHASRLSEALRMAAALAAASEPPVRLDVRVLSDALLTSEPRDSEEAALALRRAGCVALDFVVQEAAPRVSSVSLLVGPGVVSVDQPFVLEARGHATAAGDVVRVMRNGAVVEERAVPRAGTFRLAFARIETSAGAARYQAEVASRDATRVPAASASVVVAEPRAALLLSSGPERAELSDLVPGGARWLSVSQSRPVARRRFEERLAAHSVVLIDAARERALGTDRLAAIARWVHAGGGLVLLAGDGGFAEGGWAGTTLDDLSPLLSRAPDADDPLLYLAIDGSGSMGYPWPGAAGGHGGRGGADDVGGVTRDAVARRAAEVLVRGAAPSTKLLLRRFASTLLPDSTAPRPVSLTPPDAALAAVRMLAPPQSATALLPPLEEAARLLISRSGRPRHVVLLTDAETEEDPAALAALVVRLRDADVGVSLVSPASGTPREHAEAVRAALAAAGARLVDAATPAELAGALLAAEERARSDAERLADRTLRSTGVLLGGQPLVAPSALARQVQRTWAAEDADVLIETTRGEPVAAIRRAGLGTVAALAWRPADAAWIAAGADSSGEAATVLRRLIAASRGPSASALRVESSGVRVTVAGAGADGAPTPVRLAFRSTADAATAGGEPEQTVWLRPSADGLLVADLPGGAGSVDGARSVDGVGRLLASDGRTLASVGLGRPAPEEFRVVRAADTDILRSLAVGPDPTESVSLRPWLAALSVLLLLASSAFALHRRGRHEALAHTPRAQ